MKIESIGTSPAGNPVIVMRLGGEELEIIHGLLKLSLEHTPSIPSTAKTIQRMRAMCRCFSSHHVQDWIDGDYPD